MSLPFQPIVQSIITDTSRMRWRACKRTGTPATLHVLTDLNLSRELFEILRRHLSCIYHPPAEKEDDRGDYYERLKVFFFVARCCSLSVHDICLEPLRVLACLSFLRAARLYTCGPTRTTSKCSFFFELQPRKARKAKRALAFGTCEAEQLSDGLAAGRKDLVKSTAGLLAHCSGDALIPSALIQSESCMIVARRCYGRLVRRTEYSVF
eukprot:1941415-Pleurochrysis_carterae.AAC.2